MDDKKLESLHDSYKKKAQARGGRGGLGKGSSNANRIQIEYVEDEAAPAPEQTEKPSADPKHIYIKFVRASSGPGAKPGKSDEAPNKKIKTFDSDDEAEKSPSQIHGSSIKTVDVSEGEDVLEAFENGQTVLNGLGMLSKAKLKLSNGESEKLKNCTLVSLTSTKDGVLSALVVDQAKGELSGHLKKAKAGSGGVRMLLQALN